MRIMRIFNVRCYILGCGLNEVVHYHDINGAVEFLTEHWFRLHKDFTKDMRFAAEWVFVKEIFSDPNAVTVECQKPGCYLGPIKMPDDKNTKHYVKTHSINWGAGHIVTVQKEGGAKHIAPLDITGVIDPHSVDAIERIKRITQQMYGAFDEMTNYDENEGEEDNGNDKE